VDCEKFESLLIDELYGELDEVTSAAVRRHAAGCARCGALLSGLRATRKVAALPMEEPSIDLEDRILSAVREQQKVLPFRARASSVLSRAGAWAMRPQTAMAAVFLLVIGTSFVLVQSRKTMSTAGLSAEGMPAMQAGAPMAATASAYAFDQKESAFAHGVEEKRAEPTPRALPSTVTATTEVAGNDDRERDKAKDELAKNDLDGITNAAPIAGDLSRARSMNGQGQAAPPPGGYAAGTSGGGGATNVPNATIQQNVDPSLAAATDVKNKNGCAAAAPMFDALRGRAGVGGQATLEAARCYRSIGNNDAARQRYASLQSTPYATIAQQELDAMAPAAARKAAPAHMDEVSAAQAQQRAQTRATTQPAATATTSPAQQAKPTTEKGAATY